MRLEGSLDAFSLPDIFSLLSMTKKTGGLHLRRDGVEGVVWLTDGALTGGTPDVARASVARRLAASKEVPGDAIAAAVSRLADDKSVGIVRALREDSDVDKEHLQAVVAEQIVDTVFDLLRWPDGTFEFDVDEANIDDIGVTRTVDDVVAEARQRLEEWEALGDRVPQPDVVLALNPLPEADPALTGEEWELVTLVDGRRSVEEIVTFAGRGQYAVLSALCGLLDRGLISDNPAIAGVDERQSVLSRLEGGVPAQRTDTSPSDDVAGVEPATEAADDPIDDEATDPVGEPASEGDDRVTEAVDEGSAVDPEAAAAVPDGEQAAVEDASESAAAVDSDSPDVAEPNAAEPNPAEPNPAEPNAESDEVTAAAEAEDGPMADVQPITRVPGQGRDLSKVTPQRPEPFIPARQPDHPEPVAAVAGGGVAAAPSNAIERDPSVNKSLLLRLIAGVRGL